MIIQITCPKCCGVNRVDEEKCWKCNRLITEDEKQSAINDAEAKIALDEENRALEERKTAKENEVILDHARQSGQWDNVPDNLLEKEASKILLTTSYVVAKRDIVREIDIVTAEVVYGVNVFRDLFAGVRDIVGGRSSALQKVLKDARKTVLSEMRKDALTIGADAVIAISLAYQEISGAKSGLIMLVASGTAVKLDNV